MKLYNLVISGGLQRPNGNEAQVGDTVRLYLDTVANPDFPETIQGVIENPIAKVNCGQDRSYVIEYDEEFTVRVCDVLDSMIIDPISLLREEVDSIVNPEIHDIATDSEKLALTGIPVFYTVRIANKNNRIDTYIGGSPSNPDNWTTSGPTPDVSRAIITSNAVMTGLRPIPLIYSVWSSTLVNGGFRGTFELGIDIQTTTTTASSAIVISNANTTAMQMAIAGQPAYEAGWNKPFRASVLFTIDGSGASTITRIHFGHRYDNTTVGDLSVRGIGIKVVNNALYVVAHNGTSLVTSDPLGFLNTTSPSTAYEIELYSDGNGNLNAWLNGALIHTGTGAPTTNSNAENGISCSVSNGASTDNNRLVVGQISVFR